LTVCLAEAHPGDIETGRGWRERHRRGEYNDWLLRGVAVGIVGAVVVGFATGSAGWALGIGAVAIVALWVFWGGDYPPDRS
jgi:hypothetical protein